MTTELVGRLRETADAWPTVYDSDRANIALLREAADAIEAMGRDAARLDWLERNFVQVADEHGTGSQLYFGTYATAPLRQAIDAAAGGV